MAASPDPTGLDADAPLPDDAVEVGRVLGAWGVKGGIRVKPFAADPQALFSSRRWFLLPPETPLPRGPGAAGRLPPLLRVVQAREHGDGVVATVRGIDDRDAAQALAGARVLVPRASFPTPDDDEFYWVDLIGLAVRNRDDVELGRVVGLIETGPHCVLRIEQDAAAAGPAQTDVAPATAEPREQPVTAARERLIPFVAAYVDAVDLPGRLITVDWDPED